MNEETITVADVSAGQGGHPDAAPGEPVSLPVVDVLTGRAFITGKSGSGKSNTASVVIEKLLDGNFPVMVVDTDGEYYGLKEEYEVLHAGADEECDIQVSPEHAEKLASLALEGNVPIVLDVSGYLDGDVADELLLETARHLFAKEKKLKKPFLMLVEEIHEYVPEGGGVDEVGKMLIKIGKRGRKHGLGIVGISQRPADVKKDYITQCDWLCWHRLTWDNDTQVVGRILGGEYAEAVEDLDDGEAFLTSDWSGDVQRVQFHRKETFDAGATPGLEDFERPELKSVSGDLVSELERISDHQRARESELADLRQELDRKRQRIAELERELEEARDLSEMADRFSRALLEKAGAPHRGGHAPRYPDGNASRGRDGDTADEPRTHPGNGADAAGRDGGSDPGAGSRDSRPTTNSRDNGAPGVDSDDGVVPPELTGDAPTAFVTPELDASGRVGVVEEVRSRIEALPPVALAMLDRYRRTGAGEPVETHRAAGGGGDRNRAYSHNRRLRRAGLIRHDGDGEYAYAVPELVGGVLDDAEAERAVDAIETALHEKANDGAAGSGRDRSTGGFRVD